MARYAIGDIHGCLTPLKKIFEDQQFTQNDTIIFLGDYVDSGPRTKDVLDWLIENKQHYSFEFLKGNHEFLMSEARKGKDEFEKWKNNGGEETLQSYNISVEENWAINIPESHWQFLKNGQPYLQIDNYIFVHAGLQKGIALKGQDAYHLYWKKYETPKMYSPNRKVICGHTSRKDGKIADFGHTICIDTYAYGGGWLSCLNIDTNEFVKANNKGRIVRGRL